MPSPSEDPIAIRIKEMASYLDAELDERNDAFTITVKNHNAIGFISSYRIFSGLTVWVYNITFFLNFKLDLGISKNRPYYFSYAVKGDFLHRFGDQGEFTRILQNQSMIVKSSSGTPVQIIFPKYEELQVAFIEVDIDLLGSLDIRNAKRLFLKVGNVFRKIPKKPPFRYLGGIDTETNNYASIVCEDKSVDLVGGLLTEGAVLNMFASQIKWYSDDVTGKNLKPRIRRSDLSKLTSLGDFVIENFENKMTIQTLSNYFAMSPKKLQRGVKHLYGESIGHYVLNLRLQHAKDMMINTNYSIAEIRERVGIYSGSHFSKVFKNKYGELPSHFVK